jgi:hypothetical protein
MRSRKSQEVVGMAVVPARRSQIRTNRLFMATNSLTTLHLRTFKLGLKPRKLSDGGGLYLLVRPNGSAAWQLAYRFAGKQKTLSFGSYPAVGLQQASKKRDEAKAQLAAKEDPGVLKCIAKLSANGAANNTFRTIGLEWLEKQRKRYRTSHYDRIERRLERDLSPTLESCRLRRSNRVPYWQPYSESKDEVGARRKCPDERARRPAKCFDTPLRPGVRCAIRPPT